MFFILSGGKASVSLPVCMSVCASFLGNKYSGKKKRDMTRKMMRNLWPNKDTGTIDFRTSLERDMNTIIIYGNKECLYSTHIQACMCQQSQECLKLFSFLSQSGSKHVKIMLNFSVSHVSLSIWYFLIRIAILKSLTRPAISHFQNRLVNIKFVERGILRL